VAGRQHPPVAQDLHQTGLQRGARWQLQRRLQGLIERLDLTSLNLGGGHQHVVTVVLEDHAHHDRRHAERTGDGQHRQHRHPQAHT
jgi:hypothetical protein